MSDENKPHDEHGHAGHDAPAPAGAEAAHDRHGQEDHGHGPDDHAHGADDHGAAPVVAAHDDPGHDAAHDEHAAHDDPAAAPDGHPAHGEAAPAAAETHAHHDAEADARIAAAAAAGAAAAGAAAASASTPKRPVWSDSGDAPFEDTEATPVYARGGKARKKKPKSAGGETFEIVKTVFFALLIALVLRVLLFQPFTIPSASMEPNLYEGDYIVVSKWSYGYSKHAVPFSPPLFEGRIFARQPERGDIVVFKLPRDNRTDYIKRVIGLPGDRVQMINNLLHINGQPVRDVAITGAQLTDLYGQTLLQANETLPGGKTFRVQEYGPGHDLDDTVVFEVPEGHYFMMGDNRDNSVDSRVDVTSNGVGLVPAENLIGKAEIILFSWSPGASLWNPVTWFANVRPSRFFTVLN